MADDAKRCDRCEHWEPIEDWAGWCHAPLPEWVEQPGDGSNMPGPDHGRECAAFLAREEEA